MAKAEKPDKKDKKSLASELLDDDFFKPPVESKVSGKGSAPTGGKSTGPSRPEGKSSGSLGIVVVLLLLLGGGGAAIYFLNPGGLKDKLLGSSAPLQTSVPTPSPRPQPAPAALVNSQPATAEPAAPEEGTTTEAKKETRYYLRLESVMSGSEAHLKTKKVLDLLGLPYSESEKVRTKTLTNLYLNRKYPVREEAQAALDVLLAMGLSTQPEIVELGPEEFTIKFGTFESASDVKSLATAIESDGEFETVKTSEKLDEKWTTVYINKERPINLKKDADTVKGLLDSKEIPASIEAVEVTVGQ